MPVKPSHRRIDPAVSGPFQVGTHPQSLPQRVGSGRHPGQAVATVLRYSPSESSEATPIAVSRVGPPSEAAAGTPRTTSFVGILSLPAKGTSVYLTLACVQTGPSYRVTQRDSR